MRGCKGWDYACRDPGDFIDCLSFSSGGGPVAQGNSRRLEQHQRDQVGKFFNLDEKVSDEFYRRLIPSLNPSGIVERDKIKLVIDSAIERGLTDKPLDPDAVTDFSIAKQLRF